MKPINKKMLISVAVLGSIVLIADIILFFALEAISGTAFGITALLSAPFAIIPLMFLFAPAEMEVFLKDSMIVKNGWLPRTKESTLFEIASALILICAWIIALATHSKEIIPLFISSVIVIGMLVKAYSKTPSALSLWSIWSATNMEQLLMRARYLRVLAVETALFGLLIVCPGVNFNIIIGILLPLYILTSIGFVILKNRAKGSD